MSKELNRELPPIFLSKTILADSVVDLNMTTKVSKLLKIFISTVFSWLSWGLTNRTLRDFTVTTWISHTMYGMGLIFFRVQMDLVINLCKIPLTSRMRMVLSSGGSSISSVIPLAAIGRCFKPFWQQTFDGGLRPEKTRISWFPYVFPREGSFLASEKSKGGCRTQKCFREYSRSCFSCWHLLFLSCTLFSSLKLLRELNFFSFILESSLHIT